MANEAMSLLSNTQGAQAKITMGSKVLKYGSYSADEGAIH